VLRRQTAAARTRRSLCDRPTPRNFKAHPALRWQAPPLTHHLVKYPRPPGLKHDPPSAQDPPATHPSRVPPLPRETRLRLIVNVRRKPLQRPPGANSPRPLAPRPAGISPPPHPKRRLGRIWSTDTPAGLQPHLTRAASQHDTKRMHRCSRSKVIRISSGFTLRPAPSGAGGALCD